MTQVGVGELHAATCETRAAWPAWACTALDAAPCALDPRDVGDVGEGNARSGSPSAPQCLAVGRLAAGSKPGLWWSARPCVGSRPHPHVKLACGHGQVVLEVVEVPCLAAEYALAVRQLVLCDPAWGPQEMMVVGVGVRLLHVCGPLVTRRSLGQYSSWPLPMVRCLRANSCGPHGLFRVTATEHSAPHARIHQAPQFYI